MSLLLTSFIADVFTADAASLKEHKLWTSTVEQHNYANKQRRSL
jgi:hypothetical protein